MTNLSFDESRHLVVRTGYGPEIEKIHSYQQLTQYSAIESILKFPKDFTVPVPNLNSYDALRQLRNPKNRKEFNTRFRQDVNKLKLWSLRQALSNPNALQEKMTWFWHNHFTSSYMKSRRTLNLMLNQDLAIRKNALGNFAELLHEMAYDPMMLVYLDGISNKKESPNENFARELLELFTLGEGNYSEQDIKETARAFTGWNISGKTKLGSLRKKHADTGQKTIFNQTGRFSSDDVLRLVLNHPRTAEFIAEKFWTEFVSLDKPNELTIKSWAKIFRSKNYDITALLRTVLNSREFWDANNRAKLIKSPLDLVVGTFRSLDLEDKNLPMRSILIQLKSMGQDLYNPPNVKGWQGGELWINDVALPIRQHFLRKLSRGNQIQQPIGKQMMMGMRKKKNIMPATEIPKLPQEQWERWLLPMSSVTTINQKISRKRLQAILLDPTYQLK